MHSAITKLINHMHNDEEAVQYHSLALQTVFGDVAEEYGLGTLNDLENFFGPDSFYQIYPVMLEFFFTNVYNEDADWNIIDTFLAMPKNGLVKNEKVYLKALRPSVMSLYEVTDIEPDKSLTLKDMIRGGKSIQIKEKSLTHYVSKWECLGLRLLDMGDHLEAAGGCLRMERNVAEELAPWLKEMRDMTVESLSLQDTSISEEKIAHYAEVLWASEIALAWIEHHMKAQDQNSPQLLNNDGHAISPVTIIFPVTKNHDKIESFFDKHKDFELDGADEWVWLKKVKGRKNQDASYTICGHVVLYDDRLELRVNSRERANILEDLISKKLGEMLGNPEWKYTNRPSASVEAFLEGLPEGGEDGDENQEDLSPQDLEEILLKMKDDHYHQWIGSRIPALDGKTPRMAKRSKNDRARLVSLLKDIENHEHHQAKAKGIKPYDMTWMWEELGLDRKSA